MTTYGVSVNPLAFNTNYTYSTISQNLSPQLSTGYALNDVQGLTTTTMGVGGGVGDAAVDVTYSTKPDTQPQTLNTLNYATGSYSTASYEFGSGGVQNVGLTTTQGNAMINTTGSVMGFGAGGDNAIDVTYSTKPDNTLGFTTTTGAVTTTTNTATTGGVMGFGAGGDNAIDVTYSTKPDNGLGSATTT